MKRIAHYVRSAHWDREWYEPFQGYRIRLVSMLDEVFTTLAKDPSFRFMMDGQFIPIDDYLEIRPEQAEVVRGFVKEGRLKVGPWYVAPDEVLVSGESLVRNLQMGIQCANDYSAPSALVGFVPDQFGHIGQLPQIFQQMGIGGAYVWRGTRERESRGHFSWHSPDGTKIPTYRFGPSGYGMLAYRVRDVFTPEKPLVFSVAVDKLVEYTRYEAGRSSLSPILLFDGADHLEIEPNMAKIIAAANEILAADRIEIQSSDLDRYQAAMLAEQSQISRNVHGELRETGLEAHAVDEQWMIGGCLASRIHLKQRNAECEDELCLWAEPFCTFATEALGLDYPVGFLKTAWRHLLENHPHDSICGCSIDQVHQDMIYRFDQSIAISSRLAQRAMTAITQAATPADRPANSIVIGIFNHTSEELDEPIDLDIPLPATWPTKFSEFFGFEEKFSFRLRDPDGQEVPYQLVHQQRDRTGFRTSRYKFPVVENRHLISVTAKVKVPAFGYLTVVVEPFEGPTRYLGSMVVSHHCIENELLRVTINSNGTLRVLEKSTGKTYEQVLTFEQRADIGNGWFHGVAVNDQIITNAAAIADVSIIADGLHKATLRIELTMNVPAAFDFSTMTRSEQKAPLRIISDITLRHGSDRIEVTTTVHNTVQDHRLRVLLPTDLQSQTYWSDSAFDCVERPVAVAEDNVVRKELDLETRPQISWTAYGDGHSGVAVVSRGLPESAIIDRPDRPIALTLLRAFRKAVFSNDNLGGQVQGVHEFRYDIVFYSGPVPAKKLFLLGQRVAATVRQIALHPLDAVATEPKLPRRHSFASISGELVVTSIQHSAGRRLMRVFNPTSKTVEFSLEKVSNLQRITLNGDEDANASSSLSAKRILTLMMAPSRSFQKK